MLDTFRLMYKEGASGSGKSNGSFTLVQPGRLTRGLLSVVTQPAAAHLRDRTHQRGAFTPRLRQSRFNPSRPLQPPEDERVEPNA